MTVKTQESIGTFRRMKEKQSSIQDHDERLKTALIDACEDNQIPDGIRNEVVENGLHRFVIDKENNVKSISSWSDLNEYITSYKEKAYVKRALELGVRGYVLKDDASDNLVDCISRVLAGEVFVSPVFGRPEPFQPLLTNTETELFGKLTRAECRVLLLVARFMTSKEIAAELNISHRTVQNHRNNITHKLGIKGIHQLANFAHQHERELTGLFVKSGKVSGNR